MRSRATRALSINSMGNEITQDDVAILIKLFFEFLRVHDKVSSDYIRYHPVWLKDDSTCRTFCNLFLSRHSYLSKTQYPLQEWLGS